MNKGLDYSIYLNNLLLYTIKNKNFFLSINNENPLLCYNSITNKCYESSNQLCLLIYNYLSCSSYNYLKKEEAEKNNINIDKSKYFTLIENGEQIIDKTVYPVEHSDNYKNIILNVKTNFFNSISSYSISDVSLYYLYNFSNYINCCCNGFPYFHVPYKNDLYNDTLNALHYNKYFLIKMSYNSYFSIIRR